ncbi:hypothetical protein [Microcoleus sp. D2_18a_D3]|uniref:hypothetical protein n=1 Tax=Microcoleus sp. D2_18a_D3 TaxID=3055330 RepID=UPI002FD5784E
MNSKGKGVLWFDSGHSRYFLISDSRDILSGDFIISNLNNEENKVDRTALTPFEITESEAQTYLQNEINQAIEDAKNALSNMIAFSIEKESQPPQSSTKPQTTILELVAALLGITPQELQNNPTSVQARIQNLLTEFKKIINSSLSEDAAKIDLARQQMRSLQTILKAQGVDLGETLENFPERLHDLYFSKTPTPYLQELTVKLRIFADKLDSAAIKQNLGEAMINFVNSYYEVFGNEEELKEKQRREQEYKHLAEDAIAQSLKDFKMPSLDFQDLLGP